MLLLAGCSNFDIPDYQSINEWVHDNVDYVADVDHEVKTPLETLTEGGDCEDLAILLLKMVKDEYRVRGRLVVYQMDEYTKHAIVEFDQYYDPTNGVTFEYIDPELITVIVSYEKAMYWAIKY